MERATPELIDAAAVYLTALAGSYGLTELRHGAAGYLVVNVASDRTYFDLCRFEEAASAHLRVRISAVPAGTSAARRTVGRAIGTSRPPFPGTRTSSGSVPRRPLPAPLSPEPPRTPAAAPTILSPRPDSRRAR